MHVERALLTSEAETEPYDFSGEWVNELKSKMRIDQDGSTLVGRYTSYKNDAGEVAATGPLVGWVSGKLTAFTVNWDGLESITAWVGQHVEGDDGPRIATLWQMTKAVADGSEWESINAGADTFWRI